MEILNVIYPSLDGEALLGAIVSGVTALALLALFIVTIKDREWFMTILTGIGFAFMAFGCLGASIEFATPDPPKYEVIITDMSKFDTSKYQIVEQRGKIFVVKEIAQ
jgi:hypothetical protein